MLRSFKTKLIVFILSFCLGQTAFGQIKIGDNPQNLDPNSVLELESTNRVLVIPRITDAQMNAITPLRGALIFNIENQCVYFFDGTIWLNLCETLGLTLTADAIVNPAPTIVITQTDDNFNFEVGEIRGTNIVDFSIGAVDIQNNSITAEKLAPDSVGNEELRDNSVTDSEIDYNQVTLNDFTNDAGFITSANIVSADAGNSVVAGSDNGAFFDDTPLQTAIAANATDIGTINLTDNGDGTYNFTDGGGNVTVISDTSLSTLSDNGDGTFTYTDEAGTDYIIDSNASALPYDNATSGLAANNVQDAIDEINASAGTVSLVDNGDGTYDFTDAGGNITIISDTSISTLADNGDGTYTYTNEAGAIQLIDINETQDLAQVLALGTDGNANFINNILDPQLPQDAATKFYVDQEIANVISSGSGDPNDELQDLDLTGTTLTLTNDPTPVPIDLDLTFATDAELAALPVDDADADPTNEYNTGINFDGANLTVTDGGGNQTVNLSGVSTDDQTISTSGAAGNISIEDGNTININVDDADANATNEIQDLQFAANVITLTGDPTPTNIDLSGYDTNAGDDFDGTWGSLTGVPPGFADNIDNVDDADANATNEIQDVTSIDNSVTINQTGNDFDLSIPPDTDNQNIQGSGLASQLLTIDIEDGTGEVVDLNSFATEVELNTAIVASEALDGDTNSTNEIQNVTSIDNSVTINQTGNDFDLSIPPDTDNQNIQGSNLTGQILTIDIEDGTGENVDLNPFATEVELNAAIAASEALDGDTDSNNEIQDAAGVNLNPGLDVDKDGINEITVQEAIADLSTSKVVALGKIQGISGNALKINGATSIRNGVGNYTVTLLQARSDANYIIQLSLLDNNTVNPASVRVITQTNNTFIVEIRDATQVLTDKDWYFNVMDF
ncbi:MAG: hypothetical protein ABF293_01580 [Flavobacteriaceae bacterium]